MLQLTSNDYNLPVKVKIHMKLLQFSLSIYKGTYTKLKLVKLLNYSKFSLAMEIIDTFLKNHNSHLSKFAHLLQSN